MSKIAIILHAEPGTHDALGRALHALLYTQELRAAGHAAELILDGGGTRWVEEWRDPEHKLAPLYQALKQDGAIRGVCDFCVGAFGGDPAQVRAEGLPLVDEYNGHPSLARLIGEGFQVITL